MSSSPGRLNLSKISFKSFGKKVISDEFIVLAKQGEELNLGVTVSKKVAMLAVDRNRIKRILFEVIKNQLIFKGDIIITVRKNLAVLKSSEIQTILEKQLKKL